MSQSPSTVSDSNVSDFSIDLWFQSLGDPSQGLSFPCNAQGCVDLDSLDESARRNYFMARALVGHDFALPTVMCRCPEIACI